MLACQSWEWQTARCWYDLLEFKVDAADVVSGFKQVEGTFHVPQQKLSRSQQGSLADTTLLYSSKCDCESANLVRICSLY